MTAGVTVTPPPGFEVSTTSNFSLNVGDASNPLVVGGAGTLNATDVYVRLKATTLPGTYSGNIVLTSTGATQVNVATVSSTMGYASIDGGSLALDFPGATTTNRVTEYLGWTSNNPEGSDGFTYINGDTNNPVAYIGNWISTTPNVELAYQFSRGGSEKIVFEWEQQITASSVDFPGVDSFGWAFRDGSTTLFSFRFVPEQVIDNDPAWVDWDENGARATPSQLVAVAFDGNSTPAGGVGMGPLDQVNFATFDRGQTVKLRVTIDLEAKSYSIDIDQAGTWFGLVFESPLPAGITSVDRMVALWDMQNTTLSAGNLYESGGDNVMIFDNFAVAGSDLARTQVTLTLTAPTSPVYNGLAHPVTASASPSAAAIEVTYWDTTSIASTTNAPVDAGTYTAKVTVVDEVTYAATPQYVTYTIAKATPLITWGDPLPITYGTALSGAELNASSSVDGSFVYSPTNGAILNAGTNTLTAVFTASNTNTNNYVSPLTNTVSLVVYKAFQSITMADIGSTKTFGDASFNLGATSAGPGTLSYSSSNTNVATVSSLGQVTILGAGSATLTVNQAGTANYEAAAPVEYFLFVNQATPTVTFVASNITYGQTLANRHGIRAGHRHARFGQLRNRPWNRLGHGGSGAFESDLGGAERLELRREREVFHLHSHRGHGEPHLRWKKSHDLSVQQPGSDRRRGLHSDGHVH
jgi:hypothetical protein